MGYYPLNIETVILKELNNKAPIQKRDIRLCLHSIEHDYSTAASMGISVEEYRAGRCVTRNKEKDYETKTKAEDGNHKMDNAEVPTHIWDNYLERGWGGWVAFGEKNPKRQKRPLPQNWKATLNGFRLFGIRIWRKI